MENPIKMDDLGGTTIFGNTHIYHIFKYSGAFPFHTPMDPGK